MDFIVECHIILNIYELNLPQDVRNPDLYSNIYGYLISFRRKFFWMAIQHLQDGIWIVQYEISFLQVLMKFIDLPMERAGSCILNRIC